jgi:hypothetical protein
VSCLYLRKLPGWSNSALNDTLSTFVFVYSSNLFVFSFFELLYQLGERCKLSWVDKIKSVDEIYEMLISSIQMSFSIQQHDVLELSVVDMGVDSK